MQDPYKISLSGKYLYSFLAGNLLSVALQHLEVDLFSFPFAMEDQNPRDKWVEFSQLNWKSEKMQRRQSSKHSKRPLQVHHSNQTDLSAWQKGGTVDTEKSAQNRQSLSDQKNDNEQDSLEQALSYFEKSKRADLRLAT